MTFWNAQPRVALADSLTRGYCLKPLRGFSEALASEHSGRAEYTRTIEPALVAQTLILKWILFDFDAEAIQTWQLSLWIKTAARGKQLTSLDHTMREGNCVITEPAAHPKAFDRRAAFPRGLRPGRLRCCRGRVDLRHNAELGYGQGPRSREYHKQI